MKFPKISLPLTKSRSQKYIRDWLERMMIIAVVSLIAAYRIDHSHHRHALTQQQPAALTAKFPK
jgi:hypothetical protein